MVVRNKRLNTAEERTGRKIKNNNYPDAAHRKKDEKFRTKGETENKFSSTYGSQASNMVSSECLLKIRIPACWFWAQPRVLFWPKCCWERRYKQ